MLTVPVLRFIMSRQTENLGEPQEDQGSMLAIVKLPSVISLLAKSFLDVGMLAAMDVVWQPWLGVEPYSYTPQHVSQLPLVAGTSYLVFMIFVGLPLNGLIPDFWAIFVGSAFATVAPLFLGTPPTFFHFIDEPSTAVPYIFAILTSMGMAISTPPIMTIGMRAVLRYTDMNQDQASTPFAVLNASLPYLGQGILPIVAGRCVESIGIAGFGVVVFVMRLVSSLFVLVACYDVLMNPDPEEPSKSDEEAKGEVSAEPGGGADEGARWSSECTLGVSAPNVSVSERAVSRV